MRPPPKAATVSSSSTAKPSSAPQWNRAVEQEGRARSPTSSAPHQWAAQSRAPSALVSADTLKPPLHPALFRLPVLRRYEDVSSHSRKSGEARQAARRRELTAEKQTPAENRESVVPVENRAAAL